MNTAVGDVQASARRSRAPRMRLHELGIDPRRFLEQALRCVVASLAEMQIGKLVQRLSYGRIGVQHLRIELRRIVSVRLLMRYAAIIRKFVHGSSMRSAPPPARFAPAHASGCKLPQARARHAGRVEDA